MKQNFRFYSTYHMSVKLLTNQPLKIQIDMKNLFTFFLAFVVLIANNIELLALETLTSPDSLEITEEKVVVEHKFENRLLTPKIEYSKEDLTKLYLNFAADKYTLKNYIPQEDMFFSDNSISVRKIYPNPASVAAYLDYNLLQNIKAKVTIRNILGKVIKEYDLPRGERKIRIPTTEFDTGIYLYTLSINGQAKSSRKLIVKHD